MARLRVVATVSWEVDGETPEQVADLAQKQLDGINFPKDNTNFRFLSRFDKLKDKPKKIRLGEFLPEDVIPYITREETKREYTIDGKVYAVRMNSQRYFIFRESLQCAACGLVGCKMILEQHPSDKSPHFNLYAEEDGKLVMMTKDHVQPKAFGGEDRHSNYQTMCIICNNLKGAANITLQGIRELRRVYNENKEKLSKKQLFQLLQEMKFKVALPRVEKRISTNQRHVHAADKKAQESLVVACCDLNVWKLDGLLVGRSVYEQVNGEQVACIKKGTELEPVGSQGRKVVVKLTECETMAVSQGLVDYKENLIEGAGDVSLQFADNAGGTAEDLPDRSHDPVREERRILDSQIA
jgi:5-methylcytosine-specific restriction endonuclease McrA